MKLIDKAILEPLFRLKKHFRKGAFGRKYSRVELPLRSELLSSEQMKQHGRALANVHKLTDERASEQLLARLNDNEDVLIETCKQLTSVVKDNRPIAPAEEWFLDNFYLIDEHIRMAKRHLTIG
ncbi:MAG: hypothetical protein HGA41_07880, partial [Syntrophaceae bacterium]|nr:hypothetical protein [Syntrophaceae bacterium]